MIFSRLLFMMLVLLAVPARASQPCPAPDDQSAAASVIVYGAFEEVIQGKPFLDCNTAGVGQCLKKIEYQEKDYASRLIFRVDRVLKVTKSALNEYTEMSLHGVRTVLLPKVAVEAGDADRLLGKKGILFAGPKNEFGDFVLNKCNFIDETGAADAVQAFLAAWKETEIVP